MSAGKLSKIENGRTLPTVQDVDLILSALRVSDTVKEQFLETARAEVTEATAWRLLRRMGPWKHQNTIKAIDQHSRSQAVSGATHPRTPPDTGVHHGGVLPASSFAGRDQGSDGGSEDGAAGDALRRRPVVLLRDL